MNHSRHQRRVSIQLIAISFALWATAFISPLQAQQPDALDSQATWQNNRLFAPTAHQQEQEKRGGVVIYDGLKDTTIEKAMDKAFDRIQNMMFIRIIRTDKDGQPMHGDDGEVVVEDDDC